LGSKGQLGQEVERTAPAGVNIAGVDLPQFDITDTHGLGQLLDDHDPDCVINASAYTAVDRAETEAEQAYAVNAEAPARLASALGRRMSRLIHISTDFVFDGETARPYRPDDTPRPAGAYGRSKLEGERGVLQGTDDAVVVRTAWLYGKFGNNFVKTMLRVMQRDGRVRVVADQVGTPTWARGLADALWAFVVRPELRGVYHFTDAGVASWYDFAMAIAEEAAKVGLLPPSVSVEPISTEEYPTPARRPAYSVLDKQATWTALDIVPRHWRVQLRSLLGELAGSGRPRPPEAG
jgi:dTDP-4-dehydrorhamnose reductase